MILNSTVVDSVEVVVVVVGVVGLRVRTMGTMTGAPVDVLGRRLYGLPVVVVDDGFGVVGRVVVVFLWVVLVVRGVVGVVVMRWVVVVLRCVVVVLR